MLTLCYFLPWYQVNFALLNFLPCFNISNLSVFVHLSTMPRVSRQPVCVSVLVAVYQVLVGESGDLVLQTGFDSGLRRQLQVLGQELLLTVVLLLHALQLAAQRLHLAIIRSPLSLQLVLQQPGTQIEITQGRRGGWSKAGKRKWGWPMWCLGEKKQETTKGRV